MLICSAPNIAVMRREIRRSAVWLICRGASGTIKSFTSTVADELSEPDSVVMDAANTAAKVTPTRPGGNSWMMKWANTRSF